jgi:hypothetical protein
VTDADTFNFNTRKMREAHASDAINEQVDNALRRKRDKQAPRQYLGASAIGGPCARQTQLEYAGAPREKEFEPKILRIFDRGHMMEELWRAWLSDAGFRVIQIGEKTKRPIGFSELDGKFKGHVDGVITDGPAIAGMGYPCLAEHKAVGQKTFNAIVKHGLAKERPIYADQVAIYQAYIDLTEHPALFSVTNCDTCEQLHLLIPFDAERAQAASDRAVRIIKATEAGELLPRQFNDASNFNCKVCAFATRCWSLPA